jgi:predicted dehydrogenase
MEKMKIGIVGCGKISGIYFKGGKTFEILAIKACADLIPEKAEAAAKEHGCRAMTVEELLADPEIQIVVNLTIPTAHYSVAMAAVRAGKSVYNEKPLSVTREQGRNLLAAARKKGVRVGCAPDTFLGGGLQTCRKLIDDGVIGNPVAATAFLVSHGPESWHPDPDFYYKTGIGPMFDMGPYYLTALTSMMGPVKRVSGSARITFPQRTIMSEPRKGTKIKVDVPTHIVGVMDFASGAIGTIIASCDVWSHHLPRMEIYGTEGTLALPDPNIFDGPVRCRRPSDAKGEWPEMPLTHGHVENSRGIGVADMAYAIRSGRPHRASGELACHILDIMHGFEDASVAGKYAEMETAPERPAPLPQGLEHGQLDE